MYQKTMNRLISWDQKFTQLMVIRALFESFRLVMPILTLSVYWHLFVKLFLNPNSLFPTILGYMTPRFLSPQVLQGLNNLTDFAVVIVLVVTFTRAYLNLRGVEDDLLPILVNFTITVVGYLTSAQVQNQIYIQYTLVIITAIIVSESYYWLDRLTPYSIPTFGLTHLVWAGIMAIAVLYLQNALLNNTGIQGPFADFFSDAIFTRFWGLMGVAIATPVLLWLGWSIPIDITQIPMDLSPITGNIDAIYQSVNAVAPYPENLYSVFATFGFLGGVGSTLALSFWLLFAKNKRVRRLGKLSFIPSLFDNNQLLLFGLPMLLRPLMLVPLVLSSLLSSLVGFTLIKFKLIEPAIFTVPGGTPRLITGMLASQSHWLTLITVLVIFAMTLAIYHPFMQAIAKEVSDETK